MDVVSLAVEQRVSAIDDEVRRDLKELQHRIKSLIGISVSIDARPAGSIPRSEGKAKRVIDNRHL